MNMNRGRKIKHSSSKNEENNSPKNEAINKHKLLTPCRRVGLNRKRKNITLTGSSSEISFTSPNTSLTEIDISVKEHDSSQLNTSEQINETPVHKTAKPRKGSLGARKRPVATSKQEFTLSPELSKKYNISDVSVVLTRCDFDKHIINRNMGREPSKDPISIQIENEAISSTPELFETNTVNSEIQTNQISTTIEDSTPVENTPSVEPLKSATNKKILDLFGDVTDESDFEPSINRKKPTKKPTLNEDTNDESTQNSLDLDLPKNKTKKKKSSKTNEDRNDRKKELPQKNKIHPQIDSDDVPEQNVSARKKRKRSSSHHKKSPKINKTPKPRLYNSDSDDDFMEKPRREKKDPDIKKKINIPAPDPLNRIEHIRIRENKSYTIMHMNNISSYVKYYDNDVNLKRTESDDNQQTISQPVVSNVKTSMILERKDYLSNKGSQEINHNNSNVVCDTEPENSISDSITETVNAIGVCDCIENPDSNDTENPDSNDTIDKPDSNDNITETFSGFERENVSGFERPENVSGFERSENVSGFERPETSGFERPENVSGFEIPENSGFERPEPVSVFETSENIGIFEEPETVRDFEKPDNVSDTEKQDEPQNEMRKLLKIKSNLINQIKMKRDKLDSLKRIMAYKEEHNLDDLTKTTLQFKYTLQEALVDLLSHLKTHTERNFNMLLLLGFLKIPSEMVGYNDETKSFE